MNYVSQCPCRTNFPIVSAFDWWNFTTATLFLDCSTHFVQLDSFLWYRPSGEWISLWEDFLDLAKCQQSRARVCSQTRSIQGKNNAKNALVVLCITRLL